MAARDPQLFERIGAEKLRAVITDFYHRVFGDLMIGFLFEGKDQQRLIDKEWEFTAHFLGADVPYTGKPMRQAHANSPIFGGHFERRLQLLRHAMAAHEVDAEVARVWIEHQQALRAQITVDRGSECRDTNVPAGFGDSAATEAEGIAAPALSPAATASALTATVTRPVVEGMLLRLGRKTK
jgi:hemoglobin